MHPQTLVLLLPAMAVASRQRSLYKTALREALNDTGRPPSASRRDRATRIARAHRRGSAQEAVGETARPPSRRQGELEPALLELVDLLLEVRDMRASKGSPGENALAGDLAGAHRRVFYRTAVHPANRLCSAGRRGSSRRSRTGPNLTHRQHSLLQIDGLGGRDGFCPPMPTPALARLKTP